MTGKPAYEIGNYLGGGVAGVVYEGDRLLPSEEYPVRQGTICEDLPIKLVIPQPTNRTSSFMCGDTSTVDFELQRSAVSRMSRKASTTSSGGQSLPFAEQTPNKQTDRERMAMDVAIETTAPSMDMGHLVLVDHPDAPSRSKHAAKAGAVSSSQWFMEETVAVKVLNPVGFRILPADATKNAVVVREGEAMSKEVENGLLPMQEKHVWWLVNPNSRNLQTLQRYNQKRKEGTLNKSRDVDRGSPERGLRLSLVAAFMDRNGELRELPLTRCIEVWGHIPFDATDAEFEEMLASIERINAGHVPSPPPSRVPTDMSSGSLETSNSQVHDSVPMSPTKR